MSKTRITVEIDNWAAPQVASFLQLLQATIEGPGVPVEGVSLQLGAINAKGEMSRTGGGNITAPISVALMGIQCGLATGSISSSLRARGYDGQQARTLLGVFQGFANRTNARTSGCDPQAADDTSMVDRLADQLRGEGRVS